HVVGGAQRVIEVHAVGIERGRQPAYRSVKNGVDRAHVGEEVARPDPYVQGVVAGPVVLKRQYLRARGGGRQRQRGSGRQPSSVCHIPSSLRRSRRKSTCLDSGFWQGIEGGSSAIMPARHGSDDVSP